VPIGNFGSSGVICQETRPTFEGPVFLVPRPLTRTLQRNPYVWPGSPFALRVARPVVSNPYSSN
jgi:hypothetical protein